MVRRHYDEDDDIGEEKMQDRKGASDELEEDVDEIKHKLKEICAEDSTDVEQQAFLPSVKDTKIWRVRCAFGCERQVAISFMQNYINKPDLQIRSVIGLDYLMNIYVEAEKADDVKEACKGLPYIYHPYPIMPISLKNMTDLLSVESNVFDVTYVGAWVRMKSGIYKGDLAKVVYVNCICRMVTIKLIPRVDLQMIANKRKNAEIPEKKEFRPPPRFFNKSEARSLNLRILRKRGDSGGMFDCIDGLLFKDGFLYMTVSMMSISVNNIQPTFDELENFRKHSEGGRRGHGNELEGRSVRIISSAVKGQCVGLPKSNTYKR